MLNTHSTAIGSLVLFERDACSVNNTCFNTLTVTFSSTDDFICFCHLLSLVGGALVFVALNEFMTSWLILVQNNPAAKSLWLEKTGRPMKGYSTIRWHSKAMVICEIGENFGIVPDFLNDLVRFSIGDATTKNMLEIYTSDPLMLELQIAAHLDLQAITRTTYELEGDRLEILIAFRRMEALRALGRSIENPLQVRKVLRNASALIARNASVIRVGAVFKKQFPRHSGWFKGTIVSLEDDGSGAMMAHVVYDDNDEEDMDEDCLLALLLDYGKSLLDEVVAGITPAFAYLESRLTGECGQVFSCKHSYLICELAQLFDPSYIAANVITAEFVARLDEIVPFGARPGLVEELQRDLPLYVAAARGFSIDHSDINAFTEGVLGWWKNHDGEVGVWADAAQIVFAMSPSSAAAERVFSLLKTLFGSDQDSALADYIRGSMMLRYNNTKRAGEKC